jgi:predicted transport protein
MQLFSNGKQYVEYKYDKESDFENEVYQHSRILFGVNSIYINAKKKIETKTLGNTIPDGFLFDLSDKENPEFYLIEVELIKHDFFNHIFPQITKFFGFFKNTVKQSDLVEKIFTIISNDDKLKKEFKQHLDDREIYKFLKDTIENSQNILLVLDGDKAELPEITDTYSDTWGKMVRHLVVKKYISDGDAIFSMHPEFDSLEYVDPEFDSEDESKKTVYSEEYHLDGVTDAIKKIYIQLKTEALAVNPDMMVNPQKYYISFVRNKNFAFFKIRKKKIILVIKLPIAIVQTMIHAHTVKALSESVQRFYNGPCCALIIEDETNLSEITDVLRKLIVETE